MYSSTGGDDTLTGNRNLNSRLYGDAQENVLVGSGHLSGDGFRMFDSMGGNDILRGGGGQFNFLAGRCYGDDLIHWCEQHYRGWGERLQQRDLWRC